MDLFRRIGTRLSPEKRQANMAGWADWAGTAALIRTMIAGPNGAWPEEP
jgi:hypothetical protein